MLYVILGIALLALLAILKLAKGIIKFFLIVVVLLVAALVWAANDDEPLPGAAPVSETTL